MPVDPPRPPAGHKWTFLTPYNSPPAPGRMGPHGVCEGKGHAGGTLCAVPWLQRCRCLDRPCRYKPCRQLPLRQPGLLNSPLLRLMARKYMCTMCMALPFVVDVSHSPLMPPRLTSPTPPSVCIPPPALPCCCPPAPRQPTASTRRLEAKASAGRRVGLRRQGWLILTCPHWPSCLWSRVKVLAASAGNVQRSPLMPPHLTLACSSPGSTVVKQ